MPIELDISSTINSRFDILIVGDNGVGKSTLLHKYITGEFCEFLPTEECVRVKPVGSNTVKMSSDATKTDTISILDSSASLSSYLTDHEFLIRNARTILFTYCIDSIASFEALEYTINCIKSMLPETVPCALAALKMDLLDSQQVSYEDGLALSKRCNALAFHEVSSKIDATVGRVFVELELAAIEIKKQNSIPVLVPSLDSASKDIPSHDSKDGVSLPSSISRGSPSPTNELVVDEKPKPIRDHIPQKSNEPEKPTRHRSLWAFFCCST
ncbi:hypothetical protein PUMCH_001893 [Australozyma saopauloensis]|uniref:Uncharacterized protein n=1 Tax=Australozyma saopauloensis TaxID=291208 RepID=A0AAX4H883_9ASCO|nr:hypothetical protein PUMCH_001893 [[Candida] saopauloensis]